MCTSGDIVPDIKLPDSRQRENILFDFYGNLLTEKQRTVFTMYIEEDYSFAEIAKEINSSPQAVLDLLKRSREKLANFEDKLGLVQKFHLQEKAALMIETLLDGLTVDDRPEVVTVADNIRVHVKSMML